MNRLTIGHVGLHVRNLEEEIEFLELIGCEVTGTDTLRGNRVAFVSMDGERHHSLALFEDGEALESGNSRKENKGLHHIALPAQSREEVDSWKTKLQASNIDVVGPDIHGPEGGGMENGSGSYAIFFTDPNGVCFEIFAGAMTLPEFRKFKAGKQPQHV